MQPFVPGDEASALINVARNLGGSIGVALAQTVLAQRQQFHQSRLIEHIAPCDIGYQQTVDAMNRFFQGKDPMHPTPRRRPWPDAAASGGSVRLYRCVPVARDHRRDHDSDRAHIEIGRSGRADEGHLNWT